MPKENKKRGRREEKKRKREDIEPFDGATSKRQKPDDGQNNDIQIVLDADPALEDQAFHEAARPDETPFYGLIDEEEQAYFKRADGLLGLNQFANEEERSLFLANVYREANGKELKLASSQSCSRLMERLIQISTPDQLKTLFQKFAGHFLHLVQHRFASHCCEALFLQAAPIVTQELTAPPEGYEDKAGDGSAVISMENAFLSTIKELEGNMGYLITNNFASHALRVLLVVLSGRPLKGTSTASILQSKKKEKIDINARNVEIRAEDVALRAVPKSFQSALGEMMRGTVAGLNTTYLQALATHPIGNPVLQLLLEIELSSPDKKKIRDESSLFRKLLPDDPPTEGTLSASFIKGILFDPVGSRLLETIIQLAPGKAFKTLYKSMFRAEIGSLVRNDTAGYVVSKILERLSRDDLQFAVEQICKHVPMLIERQRMSVIKTMIDRCQIRQLGTHTIADAIKAGYGGEGSELLTSMLKPSSNNIENMAPERRSQLEVQDTSRLHSSLLAQSMLSAPGPLQDMVVDSAMALDTATLLTIAKDRTATHVLQSLLTCDGQAKPYRRKLVQRFLGHINDMALDTIASHVVDTFWTATEDLLLIRERIAEELQNHEAELRESASGRAVRRNWMMDLYSRKRIDWIAEAKATRRGEGSRLNLKAADETVGKSGIEMARERFAATKASQTAGRKGRKAGLGSGANGIVPSPRISAKG
ncbi:Nucleolar protein 9 [Lambiella insularis]|nr:Nucleolar protein 9 [Lambiella insularis]